MTEKQIKILRLLEKKPMLPCIVARNIWGQRRGPQLTAGSMLKRLDDLGFVKPNPDWIDEYTLTNKGKEFLESLEIPKKR